MSNSGPSAASAADSPHQQPAPPPQSMPAAGPQNPEDIYFTFCSGIEAQSVQKLMGLTAAATQQRAKRIHVLFQTAGGSVNDGIALYNFLSASPIEFFLYNVGAIMSIGVISYLGAKNRIASPRSIFMVHRTTGPALQVGSEVIQTVVESVKTDDARTESILRERSPGIAEKWVALRGTNHWFGAEEALREGVATRVGEFAPPAGTILYNI